MDLGLRNEIFKQLTYMPDRGLFLRLRDGRYSKDKAGDAVGTPTGQRGHLAVRIPGYVGKHYLHRLAFVFMTRDWPKGVVDHINGIETDNRWCNLRDTDQTQNMYNSRDNPNNTSGRKGVSFDKWSDKWRADIYYKGKHYYLGLFDSFEEAVKAREEAEKKFYV